MCNLASYADSEDDSQEQSEYPVPRPSTPLPIILVEGKFLFIGSITTLTNCADSDDDQPGLHAAHPTPLPDQSSVIIVPETPLNSSLLPKTPTSNECKLPDQLYPGIFHPCYQTSQVASSLEPQSPPLRQRLPE